jgi:hypothetical protein
MVKVSTSKGMISKLIPPLNGLTDLVMVRGYTTDGVAGALPLVPISTNMKLWVFEIKESSSVCVQLKLVTLFIEAN